MRPFSVFLIAVIIRFPVIRPPQTTPTDLAFEVAGGHTVVRRWGAISSHSLPQRRVYWLRQRRLRVPHPFVHTFVCNPGIRCDPEGPLNVYTAPSHDFDAYLPRQLHLNYGLLYYRRAFIIICLAVRQVLQVVNLTHNIDHGISIEL